MRIKNLLLIILLLLLFEKGVYALNKYTVVKKLNFKIPKGSYQVFYMVGRNFLLKYINNKKVHFNLYNLKGRLINKFSIKHNGRNNYSDITTVNKNLILIQLFIPNNNIKTKKQFPDNRHFLIINPSTGKIVYSKIITNIYNILPYFNIKKKFLYGMQAYLHDDIITGTNKTKIHNKYLKKIFVNSRNTETVKMNKKILDIYISGFDNWNIAFINDNSFYIMSKHDIDRSKEFENIPAKEADAKSKYSYILYRADIKNGEIYFIKNMKLQINNILLNSNRKNKDFKILGEEITISETQYLHKKGLLIFQIYRQFIAKSKKYRRIKKSETYTCIYNKNNKKISIFKHVGAIKNCDRLGVYNNILYYWKIDMKHEIIGIKLNVKK